MLLTPETRNLLYFKKTPFETLLDQRDGKNYFIGFAVFKNYKLKRRLAFKPQI